MIMSIGPFKDIVMIPECSVAQRYCKYYEVLNVKKSENICFL